MGDRSAAARKAARTRKMRQKRYGELRTKAKAAGMLFYKKSMQKHAARTAISKRPKRKGRKLDAGRKKRFLAARDAALAAGWKPFTKMSKTQKAAWTKAFHGE